MKWQNIEQARWTWIAAYLAASQGGGAPRRPARFGLLVPNVGKRGEGALPASLGNYKTAYKMQLLNYLTKLKRSVIKFLDTYIC